MAGRGKRRPVVVYLDEYQKKRLEKASELTRTPMSQLFKESIDRDLDRRAKEFPQLDKKRFLPKPLRKIS